LGGGKKKRVNTRYPINNKNNIQQKSGKDNKIGKKEIVKDYEK